VILPHHSYGLFDHETTDIANVVPFKSGVSASDIFDASKLVINLNQE
jgi:hypothetical protein